MTPERAQEIVSTLKRGLARLVTVSATEKTLHYFEHRSIAADLPDIVALCQIGAKAEAALQRETDLVNRVIDECGLKPPDGLQTGDTWDIAQSIIDRMARLREYAQHKDACASQRCGHPIIPAVACNGNRQDHGDYFHDYQPNPCTCGLAELLA